MATSASLIYIDDKGMLSATYVHADGYPEHTGEILKQFYGEDFKAQKIAGEGYISYFGDDGEPEVTNASDQSVEPERIQLDNLDEAVWEISELIANDDYAYFFSPAQPHWAILKVPSNGDVRRETLNGLLPSVLGVSHMGSEDDVDFSEGFSKEALGNSIKKMHEESSADLQSKIRELMMGLIESGEVEKADPEIVRMFFNSVANDVKLGQADMYMHMDVDDFIEEFHNYESEKYDF